MPGSDVHGDVGHALHEREFQMLGGAVLHQQQARHDAQDTEQARRPSRGERVEIHLMIPHALVHP